MLQTQTTWYFFAYFHEYTFFLQITVKVPLYMADQPQEYANRNEKFSVIVTSYQDDTFYPMEILSTNEMVAFQADVIRNSGTRNFNALEDAVPIEVKQFF